MSYMCNVGGRTHGTLGQSSTRGDAQETQGRVYTVLVVRFPPLVQVSGACLGTADACYIVLRDPLHALTAAA